MRYLGALKVVKDAKTFKCFGLCCAALWCECVGVCREIAKIIKSVMAITELKKDNKKKRCKLLKLLELLGFALVSFWLATLVSFGFIVGELETLSANVTARTR